MSLGLGFIGTFDLWASTWTHALKSDLHYPLIVNRKLSFHHFESKAASHSHTNPLTHSLGARQLWDWPANMSVELGGHIVVTGSNRGIGLELVRQLAEKTGVEAQIYACCREPEGSKAQVKHRQVFQHVCDSPQKPLSSSVHELNDCRSVNILKVSG